MAFVFIVQLLFFWNGNGKVNKKHTSDAFEVKVKKREQSPRHAYKSCFQ